MNRAKPKRALIVKLATLLAGMLSIFIALLHNFLGNSSDKSDISKPLPPRGLCIFPRSLRKVYLFVFKLYLRSLY